MSRSSRLSPLGQRVRGQGIPRVVAATEYDALIDILHAIALDAVGGPMDYVQLVEEELGTDAAEWLRRILIDGDTAAELFFGAAAKVDDHSGGRPEREES